MIRKHTGMPSAVAIMKADTEQGRYEPLKYKDKLITELVMEASIPNIVLKLTPYADNMNGYAHFGMVMGMFYMDIHRYIEANADTVLGGGELKHLSKTRLLDILLIANGFDVK